MLLIWSYSALRSTAECVSGRESEMGFPVRRMFPVVVVIQAGMFVMLLYETVKKKKEVIASKDVGSGRDKRSMTTTLARLDMSGTSAMRLWETQTISRLLSREMHDGKETRRLWSTVIKKMGM